MNPDPNITLTLPLSVVNYLLGLLGERPLREAHATFTTITSQATATAVSSPNPSAAGG